MSKTYEYSNWILTFCNPDPTKEPQASAGAQSAIQIKQHLDGLGQQGYKLERITATGLPYQFLYTLLREKEAPVEGAKRKVGRPKKEEVATVPSE